MSHPDRRTLGTAPVAALVLIVGAATLCETAQSAVVLTKTRARAAAVVVARDTCNATPWCQTSRVEAARACRRASPRTVYCEFRFLTEDGEASGGLVAVRRPRGGHLEFGVAIPGEPIGVVT